MTLEPQDYRPWTRETLKYALVGMFAVFGVLMLYTYIYDILWVKIGYIFIYFALFFLALVAFWVCLRVRTKGIGSFLFGVPGFAYIPVGIYYEWMLNPIMASPWGAVIGALKFTAIGLSLDISLWAFHHQRGGKRNIFYASLLFTSVTLVGTMVSLGVIYISPQYLANFLAFGYFLIPFALVEGICGGFAGYFLALGKTPTCVPPSRAGNRQDWYRPWSKRTVGWVLLGTGLVSCLIGAFTFFFDVYFLYIGYIFIYYVLPYLGFVAYFVLARFRIKGIGLFIFGLNGIIGIPIDLYFEWFQEGTLLSPWGAVGWAGVYALYGLALDLPFWLSNPQNAETRSILISSLVFVFVTLGTSYLACGTFYRAAIPVPGAADVLTYAYFLMPSAMLETILMAFLGAHLGTHLRPPDPLNA